MEKKIPVAILGATGMVGQKFVELLTNHPWFEVKGLLASDRSCSKIYSDAMRWMMPTPLDDRIAQLQVTSSVLASDYQLIFSGLGSSVAFEIEQNYADQGCFVILNASSHRMIDGVPLVIPEVNYDHLLKLKSKIVTNPNCSVIGLATALKPLDEKFGVERVHITTMQAVSGAGYPGVSSFDILDNVIPFIKGEEEKIETEPLKIFGTFEHGQLIFHTMKISAHCNRVPVMDGHTACISLELTNKASSEEILKAWEEFAPLDLPSSPKSPIIYLKDERHPQPKLHRHLGQGMSVVIGRLRPCSLFDWKFVILSHNTIRGAAGCAILNAEFLVKNLLQLR